MSAPLEDYALLGDCRGAALVGKHGGIDWWCAPAFDSPACMAALLGTREHGHWTIAPREPVRAVRRQYRGDSMVLETDLETASGSVRLIEFMCFGEHDERPPQLTRIVEGLSGTVPMRMELVLRFDYGSRVPWVTRERGVLSAIAGAERVRLYTPVPFVGKKMATVADFALQAGQRIPFTLTHSPSHLPEQPPIEAERALTSTVETWHAWSARSTYKGDYRSEVQRSLLTLKALTYRPTGGIVAAPTTSLPEQRGGPRNWDYRFCWIRDATITLYALLVAGYTEEAAAWREWMLRAVAGAPAEAQVIYAVSGERRLTEFELPWLPGYADSKPVRVGNAAHSQRQLDVFGELMDAMYQCRRSGVENAASWALEKKLLGYLEHLWSEPDEGIWEVRGPRRHFTHSKLMAWVAFDRAIRSIEQFGRVGPLERWRALRERIHADVCEHAFSKQRGVFTQSYGSDELDANLLLMPLEGFLPVDDPRVQATVAAIEQELTIDGTFVMRYRTRPELDGLPKGEGTFLPCSFWLVNVMVMQGRKQEARALFDRLLALCNDVGLLAEEYDPIDKCMLGNFPQAFSHLALVDAAVALSQDRCEPHAERPSLVG
ncbi:MAG TPA: glycoside hydrolase family 15 protein [Polyangiales bacterium]|nr:glycoside hydrolase family 15 protein [Polyangiales bacterium]